MSFDAERYLDRLKPFQRATVDHVFARMFDDVDPTDRFLVADEVGLGKTMVAGGLVARLIAHYQDTDPTRRIDVVYVCSNQAIAKQNYSKIAIVGSHRAAITDRITKLPMHVTALNDVDPELGMTINFIPITPTTSLDLRSNVGRADERALLHRMLSHPRLLGRAIRSKRFDRLLQQRQVGDQSWAWHKRTIRASHIDEDLWERFVEHMREPVDGGQSLLQDLEESGELFHSKRQWEAPELQWQRTEIIGRLRRQLATSCIDALEPDLVILDEFQRFPRLLAPDTPVGELAELLFGFDGAKTLLLSATPYRMLTRSTELDEDHHSDFINTTKFLLEHDTDEVDGVRSSLAAYRSALRRLAHDGVGPARTARDELQQRLGRVMCRTERLAATPDRSGMLDSHPRQPIRPRLTPSDLHQFAELDAIATQLKVNDVVEYWKSAPYPLSFMDDYKLAEQVEQAALRGDLGAVTHGLDVARIDRGAGIDFGNARLRGLVDRLEEERAWHLLWLPPCLPYYTPGRPFDQATITTKRLVFSAWTVVPKAIATLTSYEAERQVFAGRPRPEVQPLQWKPGGPMTELAGALPSFALADLADPKALAIRSPDGKAVADRRTILKRAEQLIGGALRNLPAPAGGREDLRWYAAAPLLLDEIDEVGRATAWLTARDDDESGGWQTHRRQLLELLSDPSQLGRRPADLARVLATAAIAGPGIASLRALRRGRPTADTTALATRAFDLGLAFRALFNLPESVAIVRALSGSRFGDDVFWKASLDYCVHGNLQAVLDEYVHVLGDWVEDRREAEGGKLAAIVETAREAIGVHSADLALRTIDEDGTLGRRTMRSRFALRLGDSRAEEAKSVQRVDTVRKAFNSPFWPFVLATTSIGQEGLDFHLYSHAVVHWNLPSNPVDLEQREGRVHRFKGHAVRRNLAQELSSVGMESAGDPWQAMFDAAPPEDDGLQPFWVFNGAARIERHALTLPMSRDAQRLDELVRLLGLYRLAFGQPRQDELLAALQRVTGLKEHFADLLIDLRPKTSSFADRRSRTGRGEHGTVAQPVFG